MKQYLIRLDGRLKNWQPKWQGDFKIMKWSNMYLQNWYIKWQCDGLHEKMHDKIGWKITNFLTI
jgi:hypothetical protein